MRVLAIGDIHGCLAAFDNLLDWVKPTPADVLITLGDYVDRGPNSRGVIDRLLELHTRLNLICLRGNHEKMMVEAHRGGRAEKRMWLSVGGLEALASYGSPARLENVPEEHWEFLETGLVDYHESDHFIFVHATVYGGADMHDQPDNALFWDYLPETMRHHSGKMVICGHSSQRSGLPKVIPGAVCIDSRAFATGWLTCLDVNNARYWQADMMGNRREGQLEYEE